MISKLVKTSHFKGKTETVKGEKSKKRCGTSNKCSYFRLNIILLLSQSALTVTCGTKKTLKLNFFNFLANYIVRVPKINLFQFLTKEECYKI